MTTQLSTRTDPGTPVSFPLESDAIVKALCDPKVFPERTTSVELVETHISWIFLTDRHAYKLKKPVKFDFLDFSTPELRKLACDDELDLNRRLASNIYMAVVPIVLESGGKVRIGAEGSVADWLVKMRRLPRDRTLEHLIRSEDITPHDIQSLADRLATFYQQLAPLSLRTEAYRCDLEHHIQGNLEELQRPEHELDQPLIRRVHAAQLRLLRLAPDIFDSRVIDGRIVDGHGDLRPEHIYLTPAPVAIDCVEFNSEFRRLDVLDDLAFLAMECSLLGAEDVGGQILQRYCETNNDRPPQPLLPFYLSYRACVRAKVHILRAAQLRDESPSQPATDSSTTSAQRDQVSQESPPDAARPQLVSTARAYLQLADRYAAEILPPFLLIVRGLTGVGKSTLATTLAETLNLELLQTDHIRHELQGSAAVPSSFDGGSYTSEKRRIVYEEMFRRTESLLASGASVVLDGTFLQTYLRAQAISLARRHDAIPLIIHCSCPDIVARQRIAERLDGADSASQSRPEFHAAQQQQQESDPPGAYACQVDTTDAVDHMLHRIFQRVRQLV